MIHNDTTRRYDELFEKFIESKDSDKMEALGAASSWLFYYIAEKYPALAEQYLSKLEAGEWNNYVSKQEAEEVAAKLMNPDGTRGPHWPYDVFKGAVESLGGKMSETPIYNCWAHGLQQICYIQTSPRPSRLIFRRRSTPRPSISWRLTSSKTLTDRSLSGTTSTSINNIFLTSRKWS